MLKYFITKAQFIIVEEGKAVGQLTQKVYVPVNLQRENSLLCSARVFYEDEAFEAVYLLAIRVEKTLHIVGFDDLLVTVRFPNLPWEVADEAPTDALIVPNDVQGIMEAAVDREVNKLADFFWEINKELD